MRNQQQINELRDKARAMRIAADGMEDDLKTGNYPPKADNTKLEAHLHSLRQQADDLDAEADLLDG